MTFVKGVSGNPKGKPKGAISEKTKIWNEIGEWFASDGIDQYKSNLLEMLKSKDKSIQSEGMKRFEALLEYFKPKLQRTELAHEGDVNLKTPTINFTKASESK